MHRKLIYTCTINICLVIELTVNMNFTQNLHYDKVNIFYSSPTLIPDKGRGYRLDSIILLFRHIFRIKLKRICWLIFYKSIIRPDKFDVVHSSIAFSLLVTNFLNVCLIIITSVIC